MVPQRLESFSNGPSRVIGDSDKFTNTGDKPKLYGRPWSGFNLRSAAMTFGVLIAIRRMTGRPNQSGFGLGLPRAESKMYCQPSFIQSATSHSLSRPSFGL